VSVAEPVVVSERLEIVPFTAESARAAVEDVRRLEELTQAFASPNWPLPDMRDLLPVIRTMLADNPDLRQWGGMMVLRHDRRIIGDAGFHGPVDGHGTIEIGYSVVPEERGKGYASESVRALVAWGFAQPNVRRIIGRCELDNTASRRVLEKAGFVLKTPEASDLVVYEALRS